MCHYDMRCQYITFTNYIGYYPTTRYFLTLIGFSCSNHKAAPTTKFEFRNYIDVPIEIDDQYDKYYNIVSENLPSYGPSPFVWRFIAL